MRLAITVTSNRDWKAEFGDSWASLIEDLALHGREYGVESYKRFRGDFYSGTSEGRQRAVDTAISEGFTHMASADDDMEFYPSSIRSLISRNMPLVGANYLIKTKSEVLHTAYGFDDKRIDSRNKTGMEECKYVGGGLFLLDLRVIATIAPPYFERIWVPQWKDYMPEDYYLCEKLRQNNVKIYVDHDASKGVIHHGKCGYSAD